MESMPVSSEISLVPRSARACEREDKPRERLPRADIKEEGVETKIRKGEELGLLVLLQGFAGAGSRLPASACWTSALTLFRDEASAHWMEAKARLFFTDRRVPVR